MEFALPVDLHKVVGSFTLSAIVTMLSVLWIKDLIGTIIRIK